MTLCEQSQYNYDCYCVQASYGKLKWALVTKKNCFLDENKCLDGMEVVFLGHKHPIMELALIILFERASSLPL